MIHTTKSKTRMAIEGVTSSLEERGIVWQGVGFAIVGAISLPLLWIYSEADHWTIGVYRIAVTQLSWAFVVFIALIIEGARGMFETRTEIRRAARERFVKKTREKGIAEGERRAADRIRSKLDRYGVVLPPEVEDDIFGGDNRHKS